MISCAPCSTRRGSGLRPLTPPRRWPSPTETASITDLDLLARVSPADLVATASLDVTAPAAPLLRQATAARGGAPVAAVSEVGAGRIVVLAIDITDDHSSSELIFNAITWAAGHLRHRRAPILSTLTTDPAWLNLKAAVTEIQALQVKDGSIPESADHPRADELVTTITAADHRPGPALPARPRLPGRTGEGLHEVVGRRIRRT